MNLVLVSVRVRAPGRESTRESAFTVWLLGRTWLDDVRAIVAAVDPLFVTARPGGDPDFDDPRMKCTYTRPARQRRRAA